MHPSDLAWTNKFVGVPFVLGGRDANGYDCWGLARAVLHHHGINVPSYTGGDVDYSKMTKKECWEFLGSYVLAQTDLTKQTWQDIPFEERQSLDILILRMRGLPLHVGVVLDESLMLHTEQSIYSVIEDYRQPPWDKRVVKVVRYAPV